MKILRVYPGYFKTDPKISLFSPHFETTEIIIWQSTRDVHYIGTRLFYLDRVPTVSN